VIDKLKIRWLRFAVIGFRFVLLSFPVAMR
jgi:hypothetical protein